METSHVRDQKGGQRVLLDAMLDVVQETIFLLVLI